MTGIEIALIIVGVIFLLGSFFIQDHLSQKDIQKIADLSENEIKMVMEKQLNRAKYKISEQVEEAVEESSGLTKRALEKETNDKIMAINEYSDTVLESINKSHEEIMFLYSMLNDKHSELTELAGQLSEFSADMKRTEYEMLERLAVSAREIQQKVSDSSEEAVEEETVIQPVAEEDMAGNSNEVILRLYKEGKSNVEIAKRMGIGLGEINLVIGLFKEEELNEA